MLVDIKAPWYREGTVTEKKAVNFVLNHGGIGDYICWLVCMEWTAKYHPHLDIQIFSPKFFIEIPKNVFAKYENVKVVDKAALTDQHCKDAPTFIPSKDATLNCTGANLVDLGFAYYANKQFAPEYFNNYPKLEQMPPHILEDERFNELEAVIKSNYKFAVLTPYYTNSNRKMPPKVFNEIKDYLIELKVVPVLLGQESWVERRQQLDEEYDFSKCINLLNKTSLMQAAAVMDIADMVIGVDNGLLHLAAMTETPIVFGYTVIGPEYRMPRREKGAIINVEPPKELKCRYCLPQMRFHFNHNFNTCVYKDDLCVQGLEDFVPWKRAINYLVKENYESSNPIRER